MIVQMHTYDGRQESGALQKAFQKRHPYTGNQTSETRKLAMLMILLLGTLSRHRSFGDCDCPPASWTA